MAVAVSAPTAAKASTSNATSYTLAAFTPAANSYLVCMVFATGTVAAGSMSGGSLTWTKQKSQLYHTTDTAYLFTAPVGASPASTTPTFSCTGDAATGCNMIIFQVTGYDATTPLVQTVSGTASSTNPHLTVTTEKTTSALLAAWAGQLTANSSTPPTGWTENGDVAFTTPAGNAAGAYRAGGETATSVTFTAATSIWGMLYAEVAVNSHFTGTAAGKLGALRGAASGVEAFVGTAAGRLGALSGAAAGAETFTGTGAGRLGLLRGAASGTVTAPGSTFTGTAAGRLGALRGAASGVETFVGSAAGRLGALRGAAAGVETFVGSAAGRLGGLRGAASGVETFTGTAAGRLGSLRGAAAGVEAFVGSSAGRLAGLHGAATGTNTNPGATFTGTAAGSFGGLSGNVRATYTPDQRVAGTTYWASRGIKVGQEVGDKSGRHGIARVNANGPYIQITTKGFIGPQGNINNWRKYE